jgi:acetate---CoA ligase (ADP-forming)
LANTGNEMDITLSALFRQVIELPTISSILLHIEGLRDVETFIEAATRARELGKPVAAVKVGGSAVGAAAAKAHTNSDVGDAAAYQALFTDLGIHRVDSMESLVDAGLAFQYKTDVRGPRATIVSISGGTGVLMADVCEAEGLGVPMLSAQLRERLDAVLPPFASTRNPVDVTGAVLDDLESFSTVLRECVDDPDTDLLMVAIGNVSTGEELLTEAILKAAARDAKPIFVTWVGGSGTPAKRLGEAEIPTFSDPSRAVRAAAMAARSSLSRPA